MNMRPLLRVALAAAFVAILAGSASASATLTIVNNDAAGEGFTAATVVAPIGGNPGLTRGQQRLNVFQTAASIWGSILDSSVPIQVLATFDPLTCSPTSGVLGSAGPRFAEVNFSGAEFPNTWYHEALADKLAGSNLASSQAISARFNSDVDNSVCLGTRSWYYGYDHNEGSDIDLLPVVLHELGHGLGFSTVTNGSTGVQLTDPSAGAFPAVFDRFLLNTSTGKHWNQMTNAERQASAINTNNLVWDGAAVTFKAPLVLAKRPQLSITSPAGIAGLYVPGSSSFGAAYTPAGVTANIVLVTDPTIPVNDGCETPFTNAAQVAGNIALIDRNLCTFTAKALNAQSAGAIGVLIINNTGGALSPTGSDPTITIPVMGLTQADGNTIKTALVSGSVVGTMRAHPTMYSGTDAAHRALMYSPNPYQGGSSVSHFDVSAAPNLLMEPAINSDLTNSVDLTKELFEDIGWMARTTDAPAPKLPSGAALASAPNPTRKGTLVHFELAREEALELSLMDVSGRQVARLARGTYGAGTHEVRWDGRTSSGMKAAPGVYLVHLRGEHTDRSLTLVLLD